jgi:hypothetical protein
VCECFLSVAFTLIQPNTVLPVAAVTIPYHTIPHHTTPHHIASPADSSRALGESLLMSSSPHPLPLACNTPQPRCRRGLQVQFELEPMLVKQYWSLQCCWYTLPYKSIKWGPVVTRARTADLWPLKCSSRSYVAHADVACMFQIAYTTWHTLVHKDRAEQCAHQLHWLQSRLGHETESTISAAAQGTAPCCTSYVHETMPAPL